MHTWPAGWKIKQSKNTMACLSCVMRVRCACTSPRYGPGLVIYWFGFVETLVSPKFDGYMKDIMVKADFPSPIMLPDAQIL